MDDIRESLVLFMQNAKFMCGVEHGCKNGADCIECEMLRRDCTYGYIADRILERFNISEKGGEG